MSYSILIVDDSLPMRSVIKRTFMAAGYGNSQFLEAENGQQALELMENSWIDVVITDHNMPVMSGLEFIKELKKNELLKTIPIVIISTEGNKAKINEFMDAGASCYVTKPFTAETLRDSIVNVLGETDIEKNDNHEDDSLDF